MPIGDDEFNKGEKYVGLAKEILDFLCETKRRAYTIDELTENLRPSFRSIPAAELLAQLQTTPLGITSDEARQRLTRFGSNLLTPRKRSDSLALLLTQFKSPIMLRNSGG